MTPETMRACIQAAVCACTAKDSRALASLFLPKGEMILQNKGWVGRSAIERVSAQYLASCEAIAIEVHRILVEGNCAVVEWTWQNTNSGNRQPNITDNVIIIDFQENAIARWREYRA